MELYNKTKALFKECQELKEYASTQDFDEATRLRKVEEEKWKKLLFLRGLENAINKQDEERRKGKI